MKWKTSFRGPATRLRPVLTSIGGVKAVMLNPYAWGVDPCLGICPFPHRYEMEAAPEQQGNKPPAPLWSTGGPSAAWTSNAQGAITSGGGTAPEPAPIGTAPPLTSAPVASTQPVTATAPAPACPAGYTQVCGVALGGGRIGCVCKASWG